MRIITTTLLILFLASTAVMAAQWEVHLKSNVVTSICVDGDYVYWGSTGGVVIMQLTTGAQDKIVKQVGGLTSNVITAIATDADGRLWIGTESRGVCVFYQDSWTNYSTGTLHLPSDQVTDIGTYANVTCVGTKGGISIFEDGSFKKFFTGSDWYSSDCSGVNCVALSDDRIIVGTDCGAFEYTYDLAIWESIIDGREIIDADYDGKNLFWLVASDSVYTYDGQDVGTVSKIFIEPDVIRGIAASDSIIWLATSNGPTKFDFTNSYWVRNKNGIDFHLLDTQPIFLTDDGVPWLATQEGLAQLIDSTWVFYQASGPATNYIEDIAVDWEDRVWCATGTRGGGAEDAIKGILRYDGFEWEQIRTPAITHNNVYCVEVSPVDGSVWIGMWDIGNGDLMRYDAETCQWTSFQSLLASRVISDIYIDQDGHVVFGEYLHGLGVMCDEDEIITYVKGEPSECIGSQCVTAIGPGPGGSIMVGDFMLCEGEVYQLDIGASCSDKDDDFCMRWSSRDGFVRGSVNSITLDPFGVVWLATTGGLSAYDGSWHAVSTSMGAVWDVKVDKWGTKWVASDVGLWALHGFGTEWEDFAKSYDFYDSYNSPLPDAPIKAVALGADGALWVGTGGGGIYKFMPPKPVVTTRAWVDAYPNPFEFNCPHEGRIHEADYLSFRGCKPGTDITIYTLTGDLVIRLRSGEHWSRQQMEDQGIVSGVYIYRAFAEDGSEFVGRIVIIR